MPTHHRFLTVVVASILACVVSFATPAASAEPNPMAAIQLRRGFEACDKNETYRYFSQREFALQSDPSLATFAGKIEKYDVKATLARCDRDMAAKQAAEEKRLAMVNLFAAVTRACFSRGSSEESVVAYKKARAAYVAANGGSTSFALGEGGVGGDSAPQIARCDKDVENGILERKRRAELEAKAQEVAAREAAKSKALDDAYAARRKAALGALRGDRAAVLRERGEPEKPYFEDLGRAAVWTYRETVYLATTQVGNATAETTSWCETAIGFSGDKKTGVKRTGPGCKFAR